MDSFWIFDSYTKRKIDPFRRNLLAVNTSELREERYNPENLIKWGSGGVYLKAQKNPFFEFTFLKYPVYITKYKMLPKHGEILCSPYGLALEASMDGISYTTLHSIEDHLCGDMKCLTAMTKEYNVSNYIAKYIKLTQYGGECNTPDSHFGMNSIDFYGYFVSTPIQCITSELIINSFHFFIHFTLICMSY